MTASCAAMTAARLASITSSQSVMKESGSSATPSRDNSSYTTTLRTLNTSSQLGLGEADVQAETAQDAEEPERGRSRARDHAADRDGGGERQEHLDRLQGHRRRQARGGYGRGAGPQPRRPLDGTGPPQVVGPVAEGT